MHVHRLLKLLIEPQVPYYELCDYKKEGYCKQLSKIKRADVMHIHASNPILKLFYVLAGKVLSTKSIITLHGKYGIYKSRGNFIHKLALKWCDVPILINKESYDAVAKFNPRALFIPAFIPPIETDEQLSPKMEESVNAIKVDGKPLFVTNASKRAFTADGREIYGIGFLVNFFSNHKDYNLVILDPKNEYAPIFEAKCPSNVQIFTGNHSFCGLLKLATAAIRNTPTDGDSFTVKEALCMHKPILATDAVSRPEGTFLFKYNDEDSLSKAIALALSYHGIIGLKDKDAIQFYNELFVRLGVMADPNK